MDEESIVTIQELSNDFYALANTQLKAVWKLIDGLEDDQLEVQIQLAAMSGSDDERNLGNEQSK